MLKKVVSALSVSLLLMVCAAGLGYHQAQAQPRLVVLAPPDKPAPEDGPLPLKMRPATAEEKKAAIAAIEAQLKAFRENDYVKAEKYQSRGLRENFDNPEDFKRMMKQSYPQFANYKSATFGDARCTTDGKLLQVPITLIGNDGVTVKALYVMVKEDAEWKVTSVIGGIVVKPKTQDIV